jgi:hypothetical protein
MPLAFVIFIYYIFYVGRHRRDLSVAYGKSKALSFFKTLGIFLLSFYVIFSLLYGFLKLIGKASDDIVGICCLIISGSLARYVEYRLVALWKIKLEKQYGGDYPETKEQQSLVEELEEEVEQDDEGDYEAEEDYEDEEDEYDEAKERH